MFPYETIQNQLENVARSVPSAANPQSLSKSSNLRSRIFLEGRRIPASVEPFGLGIKNQELSICSAREGWWWGTQALSLRRARF